MWSRWTSRATVGLMMALALAVTDIGITAAPAAASARTAETEFVDRINAERRQRGLSALRVNVDLRGVARAWSDTMAACTRNSSRSSCLKHNPDYGTQVTRQVTRDWSRLGENVGYSILTGASTTQLVDRLHSEFMKSSGHKRNILGDYNQVGIGVAIARDGSMWVTQNFMKAPITDQSRVESSSTSALPPIPISGDWNGDGRTTPGWYDNGRVRLRNSNKAGAPDIVYTYGRAGDVPIVGDWNGDGKDTLGVLRDGRWHLRFSHSGGSADREFTYGRLRSGDYALAGDWNGDGRDTVGIVRDGEWHLRDELRGGHADRVFIYGRVRHGDIPVVGDWNGDGKDTAGIIRKGEWHLRYVNRGGAADRVFLYGNGRDTPIVGNWDGKGGTTPGVVRGKEWHLRNSNSGGVADITFSY